MASPRPGEPIRRANLAPSPPSPFLPTATEILLASAYAVTVILGILSSLAYTPTYSFELQAHVPEQAPSYFAHKSNLFNVVFVKRGWLWTTVIFFAFVFTRLSGIRQAHALARWAAATCWWIIVTQWFFGAPIMDRGFTLTGGQCFVPDVESTVLYTSSFACRAKGGKWVGGHDLSGHVFMLTLSSLMLLLEVLPVVFRDYDKPDAPPIENGNAVHDWVLRSVGILATLWWWMLLMTSVFFHAWHEKITGFLVALTAVYTIYVLPRNVAVIYNIFGRPGA